MGLVPFVAAFAGEPVVCLAHFGGGSGGGEYVASSYGACVCSRVGGGISTLFACPFSRKR